MSERPLSCSECKKAIKVCYTEIVDGQMSRTDMCEGCPFYEQRMKAPAAPSSETPEEMGPGLCCGSCGTLMHDIKTGSPLGCSDCYRVFEDLIVVELLAANKISKKLIIRAKGAKPIHLGRAIKEQTPLNPAKRLLALNEALYETLSREDYEQAARLRDQIKQLVEESDSAPQQ